VDHARTWFRSLGLALEELPVLKPADARSKEAELARAGGFFYLVGGDPLVAQVLRDSRVWDAIAEAWLGGAALAGPPRARWRCASTLIRRLARPLQPPAQRCTRPHPQHRGVYRTSRPSHRWIESARRELPGVTLLGIDERSAAVWGDGSWQAAGPGSITVIQGDRRDEYKSGAKIAGLPNPNRMLRGQ
jgi:hypothetical protein